MAWTTSTRRDQLPPNWATIRAATLDAANHQCQWHTNSIRCQAPATDVDHINRGNNHHPDNLQALCRYHHALKSAREGRAAQLANTQHRPPATHPGLLP